MKFVMPKDTEIQVRVFQVMLERVKAAISTVPAAFEQISSEISKAQESGDVERLKELAGKRVELRCQELSLIDQEKRLEERIDGLRLAV